MKKPIVSQMENIAFLKTIYYYPKGDNLCLSPPYDSCPWLYWGEALGFTEMTRKQFTACIINGDLVRICEL